MHTVSISTPDFPFHPDPPLPFLFLSPAKPLLHRDSPASTIAFPGNEHCPLPPKRTFLPLKCICLSLLKRYNKDRMVNFSGIPEGISADITAQRHDPQQDYRISGITDKENPYAEACHLR
jgi:hypothetical protein